MTWEEKISVNLKITTGDGEEFFPLWRGAEKEREFNTSEFNFINVYGTLVDRKKPQGARVTLIFSFDGANHIEMADKFETACEDPRQWIVEHPVYGTLKGQPLSIKRDDTSLNITEITVPFKESISPDYPFSNFSVKDNTRDTHVKTMYALSVAGTPNAGFAPLDITKQTEKLQQMASDLETVQDNNTYADFQNALNSGLKAIDNLLEEPLNAIQTTQNFLDLPATYERAIQGRVAAYENIYWRLKESIETLADKKYYESMAGTVLSLISVVLVTPIRGDYILVSDVANFLDRLGNLYSDYRATIDEISVGINDVNNAYSPDAEAQTLLDSQIINTLANVYSFTFGAKREYIVVLNKDTNVILLTHRYLGLDLLDENIDTFVKMNNIKFNELFLLKKGRAVKYIK